MIRAITVMNERGETLRLEMSNPWDSRMVITNIDGLGPTKASINATELATSDGSVYNSARAGSRNIVLTLQMLEDEVTGLAETTRIKSYQYFPVKKSITLYIETDERIAMVDGYVEYNEPNIFSKATENQISIICPSAYLYSYDKEMTLNGTDSLFIFPFSNESLTEPLIALGEIIRSVGVNYIYDGDVDSGVIITMHFFEECINPTIYNTITKERMDFDSSKVKSIVGGDLDHFVSGDTVIISTLSGDKYITLIRGGVEYNIISCLPKLTKWITIVKGNNVFGYLAEVGGSNVSITIQTTILYGGV